MSSIVKQISSQRSKCGSGSCSGRSLSPAIPGHESRDVQHRIENHPCYSEKAHHRFARIHLAVAPACNIQCNYCNRKYDCSNESRPGVTSERLTPEQALAKVRLVQSRIPNLAVAGIAGPGDPLANPEKTLRTFELLSETGLRLCLSTNGLMLPDFVPELKRLGVDHVTVTINAVDPTIASKIYAWIVFGRRRLEGEEAASLLIDRQMQSLDLLKKHDILCKVNTVLIPGVNDDHITELHEKISSKGVFIHNIMPLISAPEYGTYFGKIGQRGPTDQELESVRNSLPGGARLMRHCKQCRADAVGMLGEDRSSEFTLQKLEEANAASTPKQGELLLSSDPVLRVAVATKDGRIVDEHFGHVHSFSIFEVGASGVIEIGRRSVDEYCQGGYGDEPTLSDTLRAIADCSAIFVQKVGHCPRKDMVAAGIEPVDAYAGKPVHTSLMHFFLSKQLGPLSESARNVAEDVSAVI